MSGLNNNKHIYVSLTSYRNGKIVESETIIEKDNKCKKANPIFINDIDAHIYLVNTLKTKKLTV